MPPLPEGQPPGGVEEHASREALRERARARGATDRCVGIHALEVYTPRHAAYAKQLEDEHGVPGKYTDGLLMEAYCGPDWDEDPVSMALTVVSRLLWRNNIRHTDIGMIQARSKPAFDQLRRTSGHPKNSPCTNQASHRIDQAGALGHTQGTLSLSQPAPRVGSSGACVFFF